MSGGVFFIAPRIGYRLVSSLIAVRINGFICGPASCNDNLNEQ
jgi:hypothetical protein